MNAVLKISKVEQEQIDIAEFGWYETWLLEEKTGVPVTIVVTGYYPYLDNLGPRIRVKYTNTSNPQEMIPIFLDNNIDVGILPIDVYNKILRFIKLNKSVLIKYWNDEESYDSIRLTKEIVNI